MSTQGKSRKPLIVGIIAAVVILVVVLALLLTQCTGILGGGNNQPATQPTETTAPQEVATYDLYWNLDRADYDGKSEAGLSSRQPAEDGFFHVRFHKDGEVVELKVADRQTINKIEVNDMMGLVFDEEGIVTDIIPVDDMPLEMIGWQFYVQSTGGKIIKLNSSAGLNGMEIMVETNDALVGIWDMTGLSGDKGCDAELGSLDRVYVIGNEAGDVTHVYIYDRSEYMKSHEGECRHCGKTVTWYEWIKDTVAPTKAGHYQLMNDIQLTTQMSMVEDAKICLDLNGKTINGADNRRMYSLHNAGTELAIMDTSEGKTGKLVGHSTSTDQGGIVWTRYGAFYLYEGTLDASDMTSKLNGTAVCVPKNTFFYMYGGTIIGGTSKYVKNEETGKYTNGLGGAIAITGGKFVMHDGVITGGTAKGVSYMKDGKRTYERGIGGNIYASSGSVVEINGGTIKGGTATHSGGNIYMDGASELTINGGTITGGKVTGQGRNGGNVFITTKAKMTFNGGKISSGTTYNCGGNLYLNGTVIMNGGVITGGKARTFGTGVLKPTDNSRNVFNVNGKFYMYGGTIYGGYSAIDSKKDDKTQPVVLLSGYATIKSSVEGSNDLYLTNSNDKVKVIVGNMLSGSSVGVYATTGVFSEKTKQANTDNFFSNVPGAEVIYHEGRLAIGKAGCICGSNSENAEDHIGECDGTKLLWGPWANATSLPTTTGNYYLTTDVTTGQKNIAADADVVLDLNGKTVTGNANYRIYSLHNQHLELDKESCICGTDSTDKTKHTEECQAVVKITGTNTSSLTITDSSEEKTGRMVASGTGTSQGAVVWMRYGDLTIYGGTLDASAYETKKDGNSERGGTAVRTQGNTTLTMYGGNIIGGKQVINDTNATAGNGGSVYVNNNSTFNMYGGNIIGGTAHTGGNVFIDGTGVMNMYGGNVVGGTSTAGNGGNIRVNSGSKFTMTGGVISGGNSGDNGGNLWVNGNTDLHGGALGSKVTVNGVEYYGGTAAKGGGNLLVNGSNATIDIKNFTIEGGEVLNSNALGGNIRIFNNHIKALNIGENVVIKDGKTNNTVSKNISMTVKGEVNISDNAQITGGAQFTNTDAVMTITGAPQITGGEQNLILQNGLYINLPETLEEGAKIGITGGGYISNETVEANKAFFEADDTTLAVEYMDSRLMMGKTHCLCSADPNATTHEPGCDGTQYFWQPWASSSSLPITSGNYYLSSSSGVTLTGQQKNTVADQTIRIDLNGKTVQNAATSTTIRMYWISAADTDLVITDTVGGGVWKNNSKYDQGILVWIGGKNSTCTLIKGTMDASEATWRLNTTTGVGPNNSHGGSGITVASNGAAFNMYGGTVRGGTTPYGGGAIAVTTWDAIANIYGGTIQGTGTTPAIRDFGDLNIYGGTITGGVEANNYRGAGTANVVLSGSSTIDSLILTDASDDGVVDTGDAYIAPAVTIANDFAPANTIRVTAVESKIAVPGSGAVLTEELAAKFTSTNADYKVVLMDGDLYLMGADAHVHCVCGGAIESGTVLADGSTHICRNVLWTKASEVTALTTATTTISATADQYIYLDSDVTLANQFWTKEHTVAFCFNGKTLSNDGKSRALSTRNTGSGNGGGHLILTTCDANYVDGDATKNVLKVSNTAEGVTSFNHDGGAVWVNDAGTVEFYRGTIDGSNYKTVNGKHGVVINMNAGGTFVQYPNTTIIGGYGAKDTSNAHGGAIAVNGSAATKTTTVYKMLGGTIKNGYTAQWGGNVFIVAGTFRMYAGDIKDGGLKSSDTAAPNLYNGNANISINTNGILEMTGGTVWGSVTSGNVSGGKGTINISGTARIARSADALTGNNVWRGNHNVNIGDFTDNGGIGFLFTSKPAEGDVIAKYVGTGTMDMSRIAFSKNFTGSGDVTFWLTLNANNEVVVTYTDPAAQTG